MTGDEALEVRSEVTRATQRLLGDTIAVEDAQWAEPSRLPGWSRAHVATHIARNADALTRILDGAATGVPASMYADEQQRDSEIEAGADRTGLELQQDLDTSAERFGEALDRVLHDGHRAEPVTMRGGQQLPAELMGAARLAEVVLHHVDLDIGYALTEVDDDTAHTLLGWAASRMGKKPQMPAVVLSFGDRVMPIGESATLEVGGSPQAVLGWLTGRDGGPVTGAEGIALPDY